MRDLLLEGGDCLVVVRLDPIASTAVVLVQPLFLLPRELRDRVIRRRGFDRMTSQVDGHLRRRPIHRLDP